MVQEKQRFLNSSGQIVLSDLLSLREAKWYGAKKEVKKNLNEKITRFK